MRKSCLMLIKILCVLGCAVLLNSCSSKGAKRTTFSGTLILSFELNEGSPEWKALEELKKSKKYKNVEFLRTSELEDYDTDVRVNVIAGEQVDLVHLPNPIEMGRYADFGIIIPLNTMIEKAGIDFQKEFGPFAKISEYEKSYYQLPYRSTKWVLYYNKKIFDDAGISYPSADTPMTWDEYRDLALRLSSGEGENRIYGALHLTWPMFWYGEAIMALGGGEKFYTSEGTSNIADPAFKNALEDTYRMMHVDRSIPTHGEIKGNKVPPTAFFDGKYAMYAHGPWFLNWAKNKEDFPRDWKVGICPLPVDEGSAWKTWGVASGLAVSPTSADPELALEFAMDLVRTMGKYEISQPLALQTVDQPALFVQIGQELAGDGLTEDVLKRYFLIQEQLFLTEKVTGDNNVHYEKIINEEVGKYFYQVQDIDTTVAQIEEKADQILKAQ